LSAPQLKTVAVYPGWTTPLFMCGMGGLGGATVGFLTTTNATARWIELVFMVITLIAAVVPTVVRLRFRKEARAQFAATGGDPTTLHFL